MSVLFYKHFNYLRKPFVFSRIWHKQHKSFLHVRMTNFTENQSDFSTLCSRRRPGRETDLNCSATQLYRYTTVTLHTCSATQLLQYTPVALHNCNTTQLLRYTTVTVHNCSATQLLQYTPVALHNCNITHL